MSRSRSVALLAAVLSASACGDTINNHYESPTADGDSGAQPIITTDGGALDGSHPDDAAATGSEDAATAVDATLVTPTLEGPIQFTLPRAEIATVSGKVSLQLATLRGDVDRVQLSLDGKLLATLGLPFQYTWDTDTTNEGAHELSATALVNGQPVASVTRNLTVDTTPPRVLSVEHRPGFVSVDLREPIFVTFSEPVSLASAQAGMTIPNGRVEVTATDNPARLRVQLRDVEVPYTGTLTIGSVRDPAGLTMTSVSTTNVSLPDWFLATLPTPPLFSTTSANLTSDGQTLWLTSTSNYQSSASSYAWRLEPNNSWSTSTLVSFSQYGYAYLSALTGGYGRIVAIASSNSVAVCGPTLSCSSAPFQASNSLYIREAGQIVSDGYGYTFVRWGSLERPGDPAAPYLGAHPGVQVTDYMPSTSGDLVIARENSSAGTPYVLSRLSNGQWQPLSTLPTDLANGRLFVHAGKTYLHLLGSTTRIARLEADGSWVTTFSIIGNVRFIQDDQRIFLLSGGVVYDLDGRRLMRTNDTVLAVHEGRLVRFANNALYEANFAPENP